jgi:hypothetical protein
MAASQSCMNNYAEEFIFGSCYHMTLYLPIRDFTSATGLSDIKRCCEITPMTFFIFGASLKLKVSTDNLMCNHTNSSGT